MDQATGGGAPVKFFKSRTKSDTVKHMSTDFTKVNNEKKSFPSSSCCSFFSCVCLFVCSLFRVCVFSSPQPKAQM